MQVFRQDHNGVDHERALVPRDTERHPQVVRVVNHHRGCPVGERDREKIGAAWDEIAPVSNHRLMLSRISLRSIRATSYYYELLRATTSYELLHLVVRNEFAAASRRHALTHCRAFLVGQPVDARAAGLDDPRHVGQFFLVLRGPRFHLPKQVFDGCAHDTNIARVHSAATLGSISDSRINSLTA